MGKLTQTPKWGTLQAFNAQKRAFIVPYVAMTPVTVALYVCVCVGVFFHTGVSCHGYFRSSSKDT